jgi:hypothetical protein
MYDATEPAEETAVEDPMANSVMTLKFTVKEINGIINALNQPIQAPVVLLANIIAAIQAQCAPQIDALNANLGAENGSEAAA